MAILNNDEPTEVMYTIRYTYTDGTITYPMTPEPVPYELAFHAATAGTNEKRKGEAITWDTYLQEVGL